MHNNNAVKWKIKTRNKENKKKSRTHNGSKKCARRELAFIGVLC